MFAFFKYLMGHTIKGQSPYKYRPSATRRVSGLSPINERSNAKKRWNALRQSVRLNSQARRNLRAQEAAAKRRNTKLLRLVQNLNRNWQKATERHEAQKKRLYEQAKAMNALHDRNYVNAKNAALKIYKKNMAKLHSARNMVVRELVRNATSSQIRRNLYAMGMERGRHGTSQNNWQNWTNKLWHATERKNQINQFFASGSRA
jgi:chromosome segregation ATPase